MTSHSERSRTIKNILRENNQITKTTEEYERTEVRKCKEYKEVRQTGKRQVDKEKNCTRLRKLEKHKEEAKERGKIKKKLNNIDRSLQEIMMRSEEMLKNKNKPLFSAELKKLKAERRYWAQLRKTVSGVTHKEIWRLWEGHMASN